MSYDFYRDTKTGIEIKHSYDFYKRTEDNLPKGLTRLLEDKLSQENFRQRAAKDLAEALSQDPHWGFLKKVAGKMLAKILQDAPEDIGAVSQLIADNVNRFAGDLSITSCGDLGKEESGNLDKTKAAVKRVIINKKKKKNKK